ncbi:hypothetical protein MRB53_030431 [Persea americana]|uniref:Uncharacterized protein n=1 Tax=Persea americana TaxID=3435 RepID=A0ACC2KMA9_PERAE|nr:hypothetical protein MRB53_030431 [Persea americana]
MSGQNSAILPSGYCPKNSHRSTATAIASGPYLSAQDLVSSGQSPASCQQLIPSPFQRSESMGFPGQQLQHNGRLLHAVASCCFATASCRAAANCCAATTCGA